MSGKEIVSLSRKHTLFEWSAQSKVDPIPVASAKGIYFYTQHTDGHNTVVLTDSGTPTLSITYTEYTASSGTTVLGDIAGSYHLAVSAVSIAHIATVLGGTHVVSVSVSDTASNISSNLGTLQTDAAAGTVTLGDAFARSTSFRVSSRSPRVFTSRSSAMISWASGV